MVWSRRQRGFRQKPWNKVQRIEKFWTLPPLMYSGPAGVFTLDAGTTNAQYVARLVGEGLAADLGAGAIGQRALSHVKIHRFQGKLFCWLDPADENFFELDARFDEAGGPAGQPVPPNIQMLTYVWMKLKDDADVPETNALTAVTHYNPRPDQDLNSLLIRDDIISWGSIAVYGTDPYMFTNTGGPVSALVVGAAGMWRGPREPTHIPFPRIPKAGLNLRKGESLVCACSTWPGPGGNAQSPSNPTAVQTRRNVVVMPNYRLLCSL